MKFIDEAKIIVNAGRGGNGAATFRREKYVPRGGPDGGDGGNGGSIYAVADANLNTLIEYRYTRRFDAGNGEPGRGAACYGKGGKDLLLRVPVGTVLSDLDSGEVIADLDVNGKQALIARGGKGGIGNIHFKSSTNRAPRQFTPGEPGQSREIKLELKVLADVGLLGLPNAGKSTLIRAVSAARPKVADYPFTTLSPNLGVVRTGQDHSFVIADIPGIIEGASEGAGLGHRFLKHLMRTRILLHLVDLAPLDPDADIVFDAQTIVEELKKYGHGLEDKPRWLVFNKIDLLPQIDQERIIAEFMERFDWQGPVFAISAVSGSGCRELMFQLQTALDKLSPGNIDELPQTTSDTSDVSAEIPLEKGQS